MSHPQNRQSRVEFPTLWQWLGLGDAFLDQADPVVLNLGVAVGIPGLETLEVSRYVSTVDDWTSAFERELPSLERMFAASPHKWKNDIHFFRCGMLQGFLGHEIGIKYIEEHKHAQEVVYTDPGQLFLHGLIDTKQGTCGNMAALHVAMCRRLGWPVGLACVRSHYISRYDDGKTYHNIEATSTHPGAFASDPDEVYIDKFKLPKRAISCGSDLRKLSMRETVGVFLALRGRHYTDTSRRRLADLDYSLSRVLFPNHRRTYVAAMVPMIQHGRDLFEHDELGHPDSLFEDLGAHLAPQVHGGIANSDQPPSIKETFESFLSGNDIHLMSMSASSSPFSQKDGNNGPFNKY